MDARPIQSVAPLPFPGAVPHHSFMYRRLDPDRITDTARMLTRRIAERFPESGLRRVADELVTVCERTAASLPWFRQPHWPLRLAMGAAITLLLAVVVATLSIVARLPAGATATDVIQAIDAGVNELVFLGVAIFFLSTLEGRRKRTRALKALHELRSMAHIIDMHQLTKDPERVGPSGREGDTPSSPTRNLTPFLLSRYLDYCSEMLAILSKVAALYVQEFDDAVTLAAVNEIENLTAGLSRKIWQKIMILDDTPPPSPAVATAE